MDNEILYKSLKKESEVYICLDYYIIPESISADYCDLKCYGVKIEKTTVYAGGGKILFICLLSTILPPPAYTVVFSILTP